VRTCAVEPVELLLDALGVGVAALFSVQPKGVLPDGAGVPELAEGDVGVAEVLECLGNSGGVTELA
jgi:hypothetical protein